MHFRRDVNVTLRRRSSVLSSRNDVITSSASEASFSLCVAVTQWRKWLSEVRAVKDNGQMARNIDYFNSKNSPIEPKFAGNVNYRTNVLPSNFGTVWTINGRVIDENIVILSEVRRFYGTYLNVLATINGAKCKIIWRNSSFCALKWIFTLLLFV